MRMFRRHFRRWWYDEGLITVIALAICIPLMLLAVANSGGNRGAIGEMYNPNRSFRRSTAQQMSRVIGLVQRMRDDSPRSAVARM